MLFYKKLNIVSEKTFLYKSDGAYILPWCDLFVFFLQKGHSSHFSLFLQYLKSIKTSTVFTYIFETIIQA